GPDLGPGRAGRAVRALVEPRAARAGARGARRGRLRGQARARDLRGGDRAAAADAARLRGGGPGGGWVPGAGRAGRAPSLDVAASSLVRLGARYDPVAGLSGTYDAAFRTY